MKRQKFRHGCRIEVRVGHHLLIGNSSSDMCNTLINELIHIKLGIMTRTWKELNKCYLLLQSLRVYQVRRKVRQTLEKGLSSESPVIRLTHSK